MALETHPRTSVVIIGAGTQGRRLAYMWSSRGNDVHLVDSQASQLQGCHEAIGAFQSAASRKCPQSGNVITHLPDGLSTALQNAWLVVECVPEQLSVKRTVIAELDSLAAADVIIASNSSSYTCSEILETMKLKNKGRFLSAHSYWPPETPELEVMGHDTTDGACIARMMERSKAHGFSPFHVRTGSMGYIFNRIWAAIKREALLAASEGVARPEEIDAVFKGVLKTPSGPFELMDTVGLDVVLDIEQHYADARGNIPSEPREYLQKLLRDGRLGLKSGHGFYKHKL